MDLNEADDNDEAKIEALKTEQAKLLQDVLDNEKGVEAKIKELLETHPFTKAQQRALVTKKPLSIFTFFYGARDSDVPMQEDYPEEESAKELLESHPITKAEQEGLDIEKKKLYTASPSQSPSP